MLVEAYTAGKDAAFDKVAVSMGWLVNKAQNGIKSRSSKYNFFDGLKSGFKQSKDLARSGLHKDIADVATKSKTVPSSRFLDIPKHERDLFKKSISMANKNYHKK